MGGFSTAIDKKKAFDSSNSSFVHNFDAYLASKGSRAQYQTSSPSVIRMCLLLNDHSALLQAKNRRRRRPKSPRSPLATSRRSPVSSNSRDVSSTLLLLVALTRRAILSAFTRGMCGSCGRSQRYRTCLLTAAQLNPRPSHLPAGSLRLVEQNQGFKPGRSRPAVPIGRPKNSDGQQGLVHLRLLQQRPPAHQR